MFDIVAAIVRRTLNAVRSNMPDRLHIHHRLLDPRRNPWQVLCLLGALCLTNGAARRPAATIFRLDAWPGSPPCRWSLLMIRLRLFGTMSSRWPQEATVRAVNPGIGSLGRLARQLRILDRRPADRTWSTLVPQTLDHDLPTSNLELWDYVLHKPRAWTSRQGGVQCARAESTPAESAGSTRGPPVWRVAATGRYRCRCPAATANLRSFPPPQSSRYAHRRSLPALTSFC